MAIALKVGAIDHVERPRPPWRRESGAQTECGLPVVGHPVITRAEFFQRVRDLGKQRSAMTVCMTCCGTAQRWPTWEADPVQAMQRETYMGRGGSPEFKAELLALAALAEAHRDEFEAFMEGLESTVSLTARRAAKRRVR